VIKRMSPVRAALTAGAATTALTITFVVALVSFTQTQTAGAIRSALARPDNLAITMTGSLSAQQQPRARAAIRGELRRAFGPVPFTLYGSLRVDGLALGGNVPASRAGAGRTRPIVTVIAADALAGHAKLIAGRWPAAGPAGQLVPVAVSARAAARLGVSAGQVLTVRSPYDSRNAMLRVSGIFRPDDLAGPYWNLDPLHGKGIQRAGGFTTYGPLFTTATAMRAGPLSATLAGWVAMPRSAASIAGAGLQPLSDRLSQALGQLNGSAAAGDPVATSPLPALLSRLSAAAEIARSLLLIGLLELLVLAAATLTVMGRALAGERRAETALLRARGGAEGQLAALGAAESTLLVAPAVLIGPVLGVWLAGRLAAGRVHLAGATRGAGPPGVPAGIWLVALAIAVISLPVMLLPSVRTAVSPIAVAAARGRQRAIGAASRAGADLALVALATAACWDLARTSVALTVAAGGQLSLDPVLIAAPVLAAPACSVLILRMLPLAARLADRSAARGRRIVLPLASWSIGRRPLRHAGPLLITVISLATAVLALSQYQTSRQAARDQAAFTTGSDYRVDLPYGPLPLSEAARMTGLKGAHTVMPVIRATATLSDGVTTVTLLGLTGAKAASTVLLRADLAKESLAGLSRQITPAAPATASPGISASLPGTALPGRPERVAVTATLGRRGGSGSGSSGSGGLGSPELELQIRDSAGLYYLIDAGPLPADGRPHTLVGDIGPGNHAAYPLRLAGVQVSFTPPPRPETGVLRVGAIRVTNAGQRAVPAGRAPGHPRAARRHDHVSCRAERHLGRRRPGSDQLAEKAACHSRDSDERVSRRHPPASRLRGQHPGRERAAQDADSRVGVGLPDRSGRRWRPDTRQRAAAAGAAGVRCASASGHAVVAAGRPGARLPRHRVRPAGHQPGGGCGGDDRQPVRRRRQAGAGRHCRGRRHPGPRWPRGGRRRRPGAAAGAGAARRARDAPRAAEQDAAHRADPAGGARCRRRGGAGGGARAPDRSGADPDSHRRRSRASRPRGGPVADGRGAGGHHRGLPRPRGAGHRESE
jgi:hypothetical protein